MKIHQQTQLQGHASTGQQQRTNPYPQASTLQSAEDTWRTLSSRRKQCGWIPTLIGCCLQLEHVDVSSQSQSCSCRIWPPTGYFTEAWLPSSCNNIHTKRMPLNYEPNSDCRTPRSRHDLHLSQRNGSRSLAMGRPQYPKPFYWTDNQTHTHTIKVWGSDGWYDRKPTPIHLQGLQTQLWISR